MATKYLGGIVYTGLTLFVAVAEIGPTADAAEKALKLVSTPYVETFVVNPTVSGSLLVGLEWSGPVGNFDPDGVAIHVSPQVKGRKACVEISGQDGRYFAQNLYAIGSDVADLPQFDAKTKFGSNLRQYTSDTMAVTIRLVDSCDSPAMGILVPAIVGVVKPGNPGLSIAPRRLEVAVNAEPERLSLRLMNDSKEIGHFSGCSTVDSLVRIAFTSTCAIDLSDPLSAGQYDLEIDVKERFERIERKFIVILN